MKIIIEKDLYVASDVNGNVEIGTTKHVRSNKIHIAKEEVVKLACGLLQLELNTNGGDRSILRYHD